MKERTGIERLVKYLFEHQETLLSPKAEQAARMCILDEIGCGIYGSRTREGRNLIQAAADLKYCGDIPVWGTQNLLTEDMAAMVNGALCHIRELDDVHYAILHTGAVCVPAAMAVAQRCGSTWRQLLGAVITGVEVSVRIAEGMDFLEHRERGWHGTATCGSFGASAAAGMLLGLDEQQMTNALGIAGSRTGGSWAFAADGAMTKRIHPGLAARDGILSAYLAKHGITGPRHVLEAADGGIYRMMSSRYCLGVLDAVKEKTAIEEVEFKWFASCKSVHSPYTAAYEIYRRHGFREPEDICTVRAEVNRSAIEMAGSNYRQDSIVSAQISIPYGVALGLMGCRGQAGDYTEERLRDSRILETAGKVVVAESEAMNRLRRNEKRSAAKVTVHWKDGSSDTETVTAPKGSMFNPLSKEDITGKFMDLTGGIVGEHVAREIADTVLKSSNMENTHRITDILKRQI